ncbi:hypothetical protein NGRA_1885 [Nosema granulosis]|uniref:Uncharacterized protein n=1 Tax=Nosema granulosis TaxID=83296 RepID=A0A9P6GY11_9MICR|nr:hypothetical protein NGRA_1885 [Nosema granulosis]
MLFSFLLFNSSKYLCTTWMFSLTFTPLLFSILIHTFASTLKSRFTYIIVVTIIYFMFFISPDILLKEDLGERKYNSLAERLLNYSYFLQFIFNPTSWLKLIWLNNIYNGDMIKKILKGKQPDPYCLLKYVNPLLKGNPNFFKGIFGFTCENYLIYSIFCLITFTLFVVIFIMFMLNVSPSMRLKLRKQLKN